MKPFWLVVTTFLLHLLPAAAHAQDESASAIIDEGMNLRRDGHVEEALAAFERASHIERSPRVVAQLGLTHAMLEHWVVAYRSLNEALSANHDEWVASRREALERAAAEIRSHLSLLRLGGCDADVLISVDGNDVSIADGSSIALEPGAHRVDVRGSATSFQQPITAAAGETVHIQCSAMSAPLVTTSSEATSTPPRLKRTRLPLVLGIIGLSVGAVSVGIGIRYNMLREDDVQDAGSCGSSYTCYDDAAARAHSRTAPMLVGYIAGGALIAASLVALLVSGSSEDSADAPTLACGPAFEGVGATCSGRF